MFVIAQINGVEPLHVRDFLVIGLSLLAAAGSLASLFNARRIQKREVVFPDQYVRKEVCAPAHEELGRRVAGFEAEARSLWDTLRTEDEAIRQEVRRCFLDLERALGRVEGELRALREHLTKP